MLGRVGTFAPATVKRAYLTKATKAPPSKAAAFRWVGSRCQQIFALARGAAGRLFAEDAAGEDAAALALTALQSTSRALARALTPRQQPAPLVSAFDPVAAAAWKAALLAVSQIAGHAQPSHSYLARLSAVTADLATAALALADAHARRWREWCQEALQGGASAAHRYVRPPEAAQVGTSLREDGTPSACPAELLRADHAQ